MTKRSFCYTFFVVIALPMLFTLSHLKQPHSLDENRIRAEFPIGKNFPGWPNLGSKLNDYFEDNYGFRDLFIRCKHQIDLSIFGKSDQIILGHDHYLFYKNVVENERIKLERSWSAERANRLRARLSKWATSLHARGIKLVIMPMALNNTISPEFLPNYEPRQKSPTAFLQYMRLAETIGADLVVDSIAKMNEIKKSTPPFYRTDFHWTDATGAKFARDLVNDIARMHQQPPPWIDALPIITKENCSGGEANSLAIFISPTETVLGVDPNAAVAPTLYEGPDTWTFENPSPSANALPTTFLIGDSFSDAFLRSGYVRYFKKLYRRHTRDFRDILDRIPSDTKVVVFEHIEPMLLQLENDESWPDSLK